MSVALDYVSPLPPVRSGISDYSVDLLPELRRHADVRVLRLEDQAVDAAIAERFDVREPAERAGENGRLPLYQMGNNHYHERVWQVALERPGVVVLHDLVLHHFLLGRTVGRGEWEPYHDELTRDHGWIGDAVARPVRFGAFGQAGQFELPANRTLLSRQRGVLVHGRWAAERLADDDPRLAVRVVPMGIPLPAPATAEEGIAFRRRRGIPERAPLLGSFGFQTPIKRTDVAIRALARPELAEVHLLVAGELSPYANFQDLASRLGVASRVHVTGFLPFDEMHAAIAASDLCLNLRYPSAGETSASLLRILAVGRPVVVSDYAELGELPESIAVPVPLGDDETERFVAAVGRVLSGGGETLAAMGERARRHITREHAPARAARAMLAAIDELAGREPPGDLPASPPPCPAVACSRPLGAIEVHGHEAWAPGTRRTVEVELRNLGPAVWMPSDVDPGGIIFEVQLLEGERIVRRGPPWLRLQQPLAPGTTLRAPLTLRRPLGEARLRILPKITLGAGYARFGDWSCLQCI